VVLAVACNTVDPDQCWPNTSGGLGGGGPIPIGAGVGATSSGDFSTPPEPGPQNNTDKPNPCVEGDPSQGDTMSGGNIRRFDPSNFKFVVIVADDGTDVAGGWQEAKAGLILYPTAQGGAACTVRIGMPLRTKAWGNVPPSFAAIYSAKAANAAADIMYDRGDFNLPSGIICSKLKPEMQKQFDEQYKDMGAQMMVP
jgi:hypothetical protein